MEIKRELLAGEWSSLPEGVSWSQLIGAGILAGIGFTMSIFIALLAFNDTTVQDVSQGKRTDSICNGGFNRLHMAVCYR